MHKAAQVTTRGRQARGDRRVAQILDAAAQVFAEVGYQKATTNAIAARARASPGSLYQFFPNKEALAQALADRYLRQLQAIFEFTSAPDQAGLALGDVLHRIVDSLITFTDANPAFKALFASPDPPQRLAASARRLYAGAQEGMNSFIASRASHLPADQCLRCSRVTVQLIKGLLPVIQAAGGPERVALTAELERVLIGYLEPVIGQ